MEVESVPASECADLLDGGRVPLLAANSMNFVTACLDQPNSFVAQEHILYNVLDPVCHWGVDEECALDLNLSNQPMCPSGLGSIAPLGIPVWNVQYGTGGLVKA